MCGDTHGKVVGNEANTHCRMEGDRDIFTLARENDTTSMKRAANCTNNSNLNEANKVQEQEEQDGCQKPGTELLSWHPLFKKTIFSFLASTFLAHLHLPRFSLPRLHIPLSALRTLFCHPVGNQLKSHMERLKAAHNTGLNRLSSQSPGDKRARFRTIYSGTDAHSLLKDRPESEKGVYKL